MTVRNRTQRGRWIVITGRVVSRHRSKQQARGVARLNWILGGCAGTAGATSNGATAACEP